MDKSKNDIPIDNFNFSKHDLNNIKISSPTQNTLTSNKDIYKNKFRIKDIIVRNKKVIRAEIDDKKLKYKNDGLCKKLYNYVKMFIN